MDKDLKNVGENQDTKELEKLEEQFKDFTNIVSPEIFKVSTRLNSYITVSSALLLLYIFQNIEMLKSLPVSNNLLFVMVLIPLFNTFFSIIGLFFDSKLGLIQLEAISIFREVINTLLNSSKEKLEKYVNNRAFVFELKNGLIKFNKVECWKKFLKRLEFISSCSIFLTFIEVGYIFYLLIYRIE